TTESFPPHADAQLAAGARLNRIHEAAAEMRRRVGRTGSKPRNFVHGGSRVPDGAAQNAVDSQAAPAFAAQWPHGHHTARGLEAVYATAGSGNADGTAPVAAVSHRYNTSGDSNSRTATGTARRAGQIPGVFGDLSVHCGFGSRRHAQFRNRGARIRDEPGFVEALRKMGVHSVGGVLEQDRAHVRRETAGCETGILQQEGNSAERAAMLP